MAISDEYDMLRSELDENIKKQDSTFNIIFTILGLSNVFSQWVENVAYHILILFIALILQSRILEYRNVVYYISTYLKVNEEKFSFNRQWEVQISEFKKSGYGLPLKLNYINITNYIAVKSGRLLKHFGNFTLATFIFYRLISMIILDVQNQNSIDKAVNLTLSCLLYFMNIIFTVATCTDRAMIPIYTSRWKKILSKISIDKK